MVPRQPSPLRPGYNKRQVDTQTQVGPGSIPTELPPTTTPTPPVVDITSTESPAPLPTSTTVVVVTTVASTTTTPTVTTSKASHGPNVGAIVGGTLGGVVGLILLLLGLWFFFRRRSSKGGTAHSSGMGTTSHRSMHQRGVSDVPLLVDHSRNVSANRSPMAGSFSQNGHGDGEDVMYEPFQPPPVSVSSSKGGAGGYGGYGYGYSAVERDEEDPASSFLNITPVVPFQHPPQPSSATMQQVEDRGADLQRNFSTATTESMYSLPSAAHSPVSPSTIPPVPPLPFQYRDQASPYQPSQLQQPSQYQSGSLPARQPPSSIIPSFPPPQFPSLSQVEAQAHMAACFERQREMERQRDIDVTSPQAPSSTPDDAAVGILLRDRAKRSPPRQYADLSNVSPISPVSQVQNRSENADIERQTSFSSLTSADQVELRRIKSRAKGKQRSMSVGVMGTVSEVHERQGNQNGDNGGGRGGGNGGEYEESPVDPIIPDFSPRRSGFGSTEDLVLLKNGGNGGGGLASRTPTLTPRILGMEVRMGVVREESARELETGSRGGRGEAELGMREEDGEEVEVDGEEEEREVGRRKRTTKDFILPAIPDFDSLRLSSRTPTPQPPQAPGLGKSASGDSGSVHSPSSTSTGTGTGTTNTPVLLGRFPNPPFGGSGLLPGSTQGPGFGYYGQGSQTQRRGTDDSLNSDYSVLPPPPPLDPTKPTPVYTPPSLTSSSPNSTIKPLSPPLFFLQDIAESSSSSNDGDRENGDVSRSTTATGSTTSTTKVLRDSNPFRSLKPEDLVGMNVEIKGPLVGYTTTEFEAKASPVVEGGGEVGRWKSVLPSVYPDVRADERREREKRESGMSQKTLVGTPPSLSPGFGGEKRNSGAGAGAGGGGGHAKNQASITSSTRPSKPGHDRTSSSGSVKGGLGGGGVPDVLRPSRNLSRPKSIEVGPASSQPLLSTTAAGAASAPASNSKFSQPPPAAMKMQTPPSLAIPTSLRPTTRSASNGQNVVAPLRLGPKGSVSGPRSRESSAGASAGAGVGFGAGQGQGKGVPRSLRAGSGSFGN